MAEPNIYQRLFESANVPILIIDPDFHFTDCNELACQTLNYSREELIGTTPIDISPRHQTGGFLSSELGKNRFQSAMEGHDLCFEWIHLRKDGSPVIVEVSLFGFMASNKKSFFVMWRDLTEVREKELELKESEERFRTVFSKAADSMLLHSPDLEVGITHCNEAAHSKLGYESPEGILGKSILDLSPEFQDNDKKSAELAEKQVNECLSLGKSEFEWTFLKKDLSQLCFEVVLTRITLFGKTYIHSIWRDITERKKQERELHRYRESLEELVEEKTLHLKNAQAQLIDAEKMASIGILTAGVAHEINNPLNYIYGGYMGLSRILEKAENLDPDEYSIFLNAIQRGVDRATNIVRGLNQLSRSNENHEEDCDLHEIINNCLNILHHKYMKKIEIRRGYCSESSVIKGNSGKLHQVFMNLLANAIDAIEEKDSLAQGGEIQILSQKTDRSFKVMIRDNGCGIPEANLTSLTDPFFTTKPPGSGTGLGLSITKSIIQDHMGELHFNSQESKGTTVTVKLPVH